MNILKVILLFPFTIIYWVVISFRNLFFDLKIFPVTKVKVPVISVGNITLGGNGKTPTVESIIKILLEQKIKVAVISRGYKRKSKGLKIVSDGNIILSTVEESGDEPFQIANKFRNIIVAVSKNRVEAANYVIEKYGAQIILLDDAFQNRWIHRDLNIVSFNEENLKEKRILLPSGIYRESFSSLSRTDAIVIHSETENNTVENLPLIKNFHAKSFKSLIKIDKIEKYPNKDLLKLNDLKGQNVLILCAIATPERFKNLLKSEAIEVKIVKSFPDHHWFTKSDVEEVINEIVENKIDFVLTSEKDFFRMDNYCKEELSKKVKLGIVSIAPKIDELESWRNLILSPLKNK